MTEMSSEREGPSSGWGRKALRAIPMVLVVAVIAGLGYLVVDQRARLDELSSDLSGTMFDVAELEDRVETQDGMLIYLAGAIGDGGESVSSVATRVDDLEARLFGFPGFGVGERDVIGDLERDIAQLDSCLRSIVNAVRLGGSFVIC